MYLTCECGKQTEFKEIWILKDIKGFTQRELAVGKCAECGKYVLALKEVRISDKKVFIDNEINQKDVLKVFKRELQRVRNRVYPEKNFLNGWVYGVNVQLRNKKGKITQIRQYASDFNNNRNLIKTVNYA